MAAILSCGAMLNQRPLRRGCLIEFLYPTVQRSPVDRLHCTPPFRSLQVTPPGNTEPVSLSAWNPGDNQYLPNCAGIEVTMVVPALDLPYLEPSPRASAGQ